MPRGQGGSAGSVGPGGSIGAGATGGPLYLTKNGAGAPPYSFAGDTDTGVDSYAANQLDLVVAAVSYAKLTATALATTVPVVVGDGSAAAPPYSFSSNLAAGMYYDVANGIRFSVNSTPSMLIGQGSVIPTILYITASDLQLARLAGASLRCGLDPSASPIAQTFTLGEASRPATDTDIGGSSGTLRSGLGTGTGTASSLIFQTPTLVGAGTDVQTYATRLTIATAAITSTVQIKNASGTVALPGYGFTDGSTSGMFYNSTLGAPVLCGQGGVGFLGSDAATGQLAVVRSLGLAADLATAAPDIALRRIAAAILGLDTGTAAAGATLELYERTAPAAGAANSCRLFCADLAGKTTLYAQFATGGAILIATEV